MRPVPSRTTTELRIATDLRLAATQIVAPQPLDFTHAAPETGLFPLASAVVVGGMIGSMTAENSSTPTRDPGNRRDTIGSNRQPVGLHGAIHRYTAV